MTIDDMRYVLKIAENGSFSKAAQELYITQPTLSQRLKKIENELGTRLFERDRFGHVELTEAGSRFCAECGQILSHWQLLQNDLQKLKGQKNITMGIPIRTGFDLVTGLMNALAEKEPNIALTYVDRPNYQMEEMISNGTLDLALIRMPTPGSNFCMRLLLECTPCVRLREGSPLLSKIYYHDGNPNPYLALKDLEHEPLVAAPSVKEHRSRLWLNMLFAQIPGLRPHVLYTVPNTNMYVHYAQTGTASYVIPTRGPKEREDMCLLEPEFSLSYDTYLVQSERVDPDIADTIYHILSSQIGNIS